ncbi:MAG: hypothetical protein WDZ69_02730 [Candidatus Pacearchaeota archaeon]
MYENINKHLGEEWLNREIESIESKNWIKKSEKEKVSTKPAHYLLEKIEKLIKKFEDIEGFSQWVLDAKTSRNNFEDILFELMVLDNLLNKVDFIVLKHSNPNGNFVPEAKLSKGNEHFYVEMTKLKSTPKNILNKVDGLFRKARNKFRGSQGIHFIGCFEFFDYVNDKSVPSKNYNLLKFYIQRRFERHSNSSILAFVLVNIMIKTLPDFSKSSIDKTYEIIQKSPEKGGKQPKFFKEIFEVNDFIYL